VAARVTGDPDDADDALQEAFLAAWRSRGRFDPARRPLPWLVTIARRKALTIAAARSRKAVPSARAELAPSAEDVALARAADGWAVDAVRHEPALALHALGGLTAGAVGERLGVPLRTAASRIARGRRRVEALLTATPSFSPRSNVS